MIALIAYLQRLGTDIYRDPDAPSPLAMPEGVEPGAVAANTAGANGKEGDRATQ